MHAANCVADQPTTFRSPQLYLGGSFSHGPDNSRGSPFPVTINLKAALRALRQRKKVRVLWVDAVCINQADIPEKNVQVPLMSRLYSGADSVIVWLGASNPNIELFVSWARPSFRDPKRQRGAMAQA